MTDGKIYKSIWLHSTKEKNVMSGENKIKQIAVGFKIPDYVKKEAIRIFKTAVYQDLAIGRDLISFVYASVYIACLQYGLPKVPRELLLGTELRKRKMMKAYRLIKKELKIQIETIDPVDLIPRFASRLELSPKTVTKATEIMMKIKELPQFCGKHPQTLLASALYVATQITGEYRTQREIANYTGVLENTMRKRGKEIIQLI